MPVANIGFSIDGKLAGTLARAGQIAATNWS